LNFSKTRQNTGLFGIILNFVFYLLFSGIDRFLLDNRDHTELTNVLKTANFEFFPLCLMNGTWSIRKNGQKRLFLLYRDILFTFVQYINIFFDFYLDRQLMGLVAMSNSKLKHVSILSVCILCIVTPAIILAKLSISMVGIDYFILIYTTCLTLICSMFISIATYLLLMFDESPKSEGRIFLLKTFNFRFLMIKSLILSLNGIYAVSFESFSLWRLGFAFFEGWLALKYARKIQIENEQRQVSISKIKSLLQFNVQSFTQMKKRKNMLNNEQDGDDNDDLLQNQKEFEEAQNEKYMILFVKHYEHFFNFC
jgi:hypothetical protein